MIYVKTAAGRLALKERSETMPRKYHFPFLMCDGVRDAADILAASAQHGFSSIDLYQMVQLGFIEPASAEHVDTPVQQAQTAVIASENIATTVNTALLMQAQHLATSITAKLGLRGFRLNMAVERVNSLADLRALLPQIEETAGPLAVKPLTDFLKIAGV
jgi:hypothetical protein